MSPRRRVLAAVLAAALAASPLAVTPVAAAVAASAGVPAGEALPPEVPAGFQDLEAIAGLSEPTSVAFAPDGTAFIALKTGLVKSFDYNAGTGQYEAFADHTNVVNLDLVVNNYHDRGLTGIALDPEFGAPGQNFVYVNYTYDRDPRDEPAVVPKWGPGEGQYDNCAAPASMGPPVVAGCVVVTRVSRVPVAPGPDGWVASGVEQPLVDLPQGQAACQQFGSHASGDVIFGPDGLLYASAGDGASFDTEDWGQAGNPCGDPTDEGGGLRAQDIRTSGDPLGLGGSIFRINPDGGQVPAGAQANASRIVTYGQRNPWRLTFRPGTSELWSGDVGASGWEEVNRTDMAAFSAPVNLGWPCYEGAYTGVQRQPGWDALDNPLCENLYTAETSTPGTVRAPYFSYRTRGAGVLTPGEHCEEGTSSIAGVAFIPTTSSYPAQYRGAMFFNDFARSCVWHLAKKANGDPDPTQILPFVQRAETPVQIKVGPGGDLFYVDYGIVDGQVTPGAGAIHRIVYTTGNRQPVAAVTAAPSAGPAPLSVTFDATGSSDPDDDPLSYEWALDGDGVFDDGIGATKSRTYPDPGNVTVSLRVTDDRGGSDTADVVVSPGNSPPQITGVTATPSTWAVGETVSFSASATDAQQTLPDSAFSWSVTIQHCPSVCHTHPLTSFVGSSGSFPAPDHEHPSMLTLTLTVTDSEGLTDTESVTLNPRSVAMTFVTNPPGGAMTVAGAGVVSPHTQTFVVGNHFNVSVPDTRTVNGVSYRFSSWSDGGARTHAVVAPATAATLTATYHRNPTVSLAADPSSGAAPLRTTYTATATDPDATALTYAWDLDDNGTYETSTGSTPTMSRSYPTVGSHVVGVQVTDADGGTASATATVTVTGSDNTPPVLGTVTPASGTTFAVGGAISVSATASDAEEALPPSAFTWTLQRVACASGCAPVPVGTLVGPAGSFTAPDVPYPTYLLVTVTVKDSGGLTATRTVRVDPRTVRLDFAGSPSRLDVAPSRTATVGSSTQISAPLRLTRSGRTYRFVKWSDRGARVHTVQVPTVDTVYTATYHRVRSRVAFVTKPGELRLTVGGRSRRSVFTGVYDVGESVRVTAPRRQSSGAVAYRFVRWSDGGARDHRIVVPDGGLRLVAVYRRH